jgi:hypothetical protein
LTSPQWKDRVLGSLEMRQVPNNTIWCATGNSVSLSDELRRRTVWIHLHTTDAHPEERCGFRHEDPDLLEWAGANRGEIIAKVLTVLRAWVVAGRPPAPATFASFQTWARTLSAVLNFAGLRGFLGNRRRFGTRMQSERPQWDAFLEAWAHRFGDTPQTTAALVEELFNEHSALRAALPLELLDLLDGPENSATKRLSHALRKRIDIRHDSGLYVELGPRDRHTKVDRWRLGGVAAWAGRPVLLPTTPGASNKAPASEPPPSPPSVPPPPEAPMEPSTTTTENPGARGDSGDGTPAAPQPWLVDATPYAQGLAMNLDTIGARLGVDFRRFPILRAVGPLGWYDRKTSSVAASILAQVNPEDHSAFQVFLTRLRQAFQEWALPRVP